MLLQQVNSVLFKVAYIVSIPRAVGTVAYHLCFTFAQVLAMCGPHRRFAPLLTHILRRIPQAVGVVATIIVPLSDWNKLKGFNTVNSNYYFLITFVLPSLCSGT